MNAAVQQWPEQLMTPADVARYFQCSRSLVYQMAADGRLPCVHIGGLLRFQPEIVRKFTTGEIKSASVTPIRPPVADCSTKGG